MFCRSRFGHVIYNYTLQLFVMTKCSLKCVPRSESVLSVHVEVSCVLRQTVDGLYLMGPSIAWFESLIFGHDIHWVESEDRNSLKFSGRCFPHVPPLWAVGCHGSKHAANVILLGLVCVYVVLITWSKTVTMSVYCHIKMPQSFSLVTRTTFFHPYSRLVVQGSFLVLAGSWCSYRDRYVI